MFFLGLARRVRARLLFASTSEVYGDPEVHPQKETYFGNVNPFGPRSCYDESKRVAEAMCYAYAQQVICKLQTFSPSLFDLVTLFDYPSRKALAFVLLASSIRTVHECT